MHKVAIGSWINSCANYNVMADTNNIAMFMIIGLLSCTCARVCQFAHAHNNDNAELTELYPLY